MSTIINPNTGQAFGTQQNFGQLGQIYMAVQQLHEKVQALTAQQMHLGLFLEFFVQKSLDLTLEDGTPLLGINIEEFPTWAQARSAEIRAEAQAEMEQRAQAEAATTPAHPAEGRAELDLGIVLDDE